VGLLIYFGVVGVGYASRIGVLLVLSLTRHGVTRHAIKLYCPVLSIDISCHNVLYMCLSDRIGRLIFYLGAYYTMTKFNKETAALITSTVAAVEGASRKLASTADTLHAAGVPSTHFISPKSKDGGSTVTPEDFDALNAAIVAGFTVAVQKLMAAPTKSLQDVDKAEKRYWQQQIGARRNDFKRALEKREGRADTRAPQAPKSAEDKIRAQIETIEKIVQGAEALTFEAEPFLKALRELNRMVK
jgi:hypothetical protein